MENPTEDQTSALLAMPGVGFLGMLVIGTIAGGLRRKLPPAIIGDGEYSATEGDDFLVSAMTRKPERQIRLLLSHHDVFVRR